MTFEHVLHAVKGVKKSFDMASAMDVLQFKNLPIFSMEDTTEWTEIFNATEGMTGVKELAEGETPPNLTLGEGYQVSLTTRRFGGAIEITEDDQLKAGDSTTLLDTFITRKRNRLLRTNHQFFVKEIHKLLNDAFNASSAYLCPDGKPLGSSTHTWSNGGTFDNTTTSKLTQEAIDAMEEYAGAFTDNVGDEWALNFSTIVVKKGSLNARNAKKLFGLYGMKPTAVGDINIYEGEYTVIETPYITTANKNYWFAMDTSLESPLHVGIRKMPSLNEPIREKNNSVTTNATGYWKQGFKNMPAGVYCGQGTV